MPCVPCLSKATAAWSVTYFVCLAGMAYRRRLKGKKPPEGWELIEEVIEDFEGQMKEAVNEEHEGRRKNELAWKIHRIHWEKNRFIFDLMYQRKVMSKELVSLCLWETVPSSSNVKADCALRQAIAAQFCPYRLISSFFFTACNACLCSLTIWCGRRLQMAASYPNGVSLAMRSCAPCLPSRKAITTLAQPPTAGILQACACCVS